MNLVAATGVRKVYRGRAEDVVAVDGVSLTLTPGEVVGLIGPSGSGKSTLINMIVGWDTPDEGRVQLADEITPDWSGIALVPQDLGLLGELTLRENIELPLILGNGQMEDVTTLGEHLGLDGTLEHLPDAVSLGEQQRAAIGRALVTTPRLLVADEPTSHQDEANTLRIATMLRAAASDSSVLIATHDRKLLEFVDTVIELRDGRLV